MKLLVVSNMYPSAEFPGYGVFVKNFCDSLPAIGIDYNLSVMTKKRNRLSKPAGYVSFYVRTLASAVFSDHDAVYIHYASYSSLPVLLAGLVKRQKIYVNLHGSDVVPENRRQARMNRFTEKILRRADKVIVPSEYFRELVLEKYRFLEKDRVFVYPSGGVDRALFHERDAESRKEFRKRFGIDSDAVVFGMAGRISEGKGWDDFIRAANIVRENGVKAEFLLVGSGRKEKEMLRLLQETGMLPAIRRMDLLSQEELPAFYSAIDYFVFPTKRAGESLGLTALEAMACGTPVIASDYAAPKYYIENGINGYKFEKGNYEELAERMTALAESGPEEAMRKNAVCSVEPYSAEKVRTVLSDILKKQEET